MSGTVLGTRETKMSTTQVLPVRSSQSSGRVTLEGKSMSSSRERTRSFLTLYSWQPMPHAY